MTTNSEIQIIKRTQPQFDADAFYARLFDKYPEVKVKYFSGVDMARQKQKVFMALATIAKLCDNSTTLVPELQKLGRLHAHYKVPAELYPAVGEALIFALKLTSPDEVNAWQNAYDTVASVMIEAGNAVKK